MAIDPNELKLTRVSLTLWDVFGTIANMAKVPREELKAYGDVLKAKDWRPFTPPESWLNIPPHSDADFGLEKIRAGLGIACWGFSNAPREFLEAWTAKHFGTKPGRPFNHIISLGSVRIYKPNPAAYFYAAGVAVGRVAVAPANILMVTANRTFGDLEGATRAGMQTMLIREPSQWGCVDICGLADLLDVQRGHLLKAV